MFGVECISILYFRTHIDTKITYRGDNDLLASGGTQYDQKLHSP